MAPEEKPASGKSATWQLVADIEALTGDGWS